MSNLRERSLAALSAPRTESRDSPGDRVAGRAAEETVGNALVNPAKLAEAGGAAGALLTGDVEGAVDSIVEIVVTDLMLPVDIIDCLEEEVSPAPRRGV